MSNQSRRMRRHRGHPFIFMLALGSAGVSIAAGDLKSLVAWGALATWALLR